MWRGGYQQAGSCLGLNPPLPLPVSVSSGTHRRRACEGNTIDTHLGLGQRAGLPPKLGEGQLFLMRREWVFLSESELVSSCDVGEALCSLGAWAWPSRARMKPLPECFTESGAPGLASGGGSEPPGAGREA